MTYLCIGARHVAFIRILFLVICNSFPPVQTLAYLMGCGGHSHRTLAGMDRPLREGGDSVFFKEHLLGICLSL